MLIPPPTSTQTARTVPADLRLLAVATGRRRDHLETALEDDRSEDGDPLWTLETTATLADARNRLEEIDCLVVAPPTAPADEDAPETAAETEAEAQNERGDSDENVADLLEKIRASAPDLPIIVVANERTPELADAVRSHDLTAILERDDVSDHLERRARDLVEYRRLAVLTRRTLASLEFAGGSIAIVGPDDRVQFASRVFAMQFGYDRDSLAGMPWQNLFTDAAVARLESTAIPTVAEGWRWTGNSTGRRKTGATFTAQLSLDGLEDGSLIFVVTESTGDERER
ncbi:PAS domain-containing protein [Natrinema gelatinilyticum]|uniref:PAS domain-containing protein n=1 Tax=Natrinema gelatinilyticum TaxID=2961571 RepID=UPI0020C476C3|nr:PAS domain-containing protein [Natrinema gelatinilyticum]